MIVLKTVLLAIFAVLASARCFHDGARYSGLQESIRAAKAAMSICKGLEGREIDGREPVGFCRDIGHHSQVDVIVGLFGSGRKKVPVHACYESVVDLTLKCAQGGLTHNKRFYFVAAPERGHCRKQVDGPPGSPPPMGPDGPPPPQGGPSGPPPPPQGGPAGPPPPPQDGPDGPPSPQGGPAGHNPPPGLRPVPISVGRRDAAPSPAVFELDQNAVSRFAQLMNTTDADVEDPEMNPDPETASIIARLEAMLQEETLVGPAAPRPPQPEEEEDDEEDDEEEQEDAKDGMPPPPQFDGPDGLVKRQQQGSHQELGYPHHNKGRWHGRVRKLYCKERVRRHRQSGSPWGGRGGQGQWPGSK